MANEYKMMKELREASNPITQEEFDAMLKAHYDFTLAGGAGGSWKTYVTDGGKESGVVFGVYLGPLVFEGKQLSLSHDNLEELNLEKKFLTYADLVGVLCRNQNLKKTSFMGSLCIDSDFSGSDFEGADLTDADFSRSNMIGCNLKNANLDGTDLEDVDLSGSDLRGVKITPKTSFKNTVMKNVTRDGQT